MDTRVPANVIRIPTYIELDKRSAVQTLLAILLLLFKLSQLFKINIVIEPQLGC